MSKPPYPIKDRIHSRTIVDKDGCWLWQGYLSSNGYGPMRIPGTRRRELVHRLSYREYKGEIMSGMTIDHLCKKRNCANPDHLEMVTAQENNSRSSSPSAINKLKVECKYGHPLSGTNLTFDKKGSRVCKTCKSLSFAKWYNKKHHAFA